MVACSLSATLILQAVFACLYSPEAIHDVQIVPAQEDLTPVLFFLSLNWAIVIPLLALFVGGLAFLFVPPRQRAEEPQWVKITYVH